MMNGRDRALCVIAALVAAAPAGAQDAPRPKLSTNEAYIEEVTAKTELAIDDPMAVFGFVFERLPERVKVYPTENYYYFSFIHEARRYAGNIRLDAGNRDDGKADFAYFEDTSEWNDDTPIRHVLLDASRGVAVEKIERFLYRVSYQGKSVLFALNDLSDVKPPPAALGADEAFLGPVFDESAIRFFLLYNAKQKTFHYILDETVAVADDFFPAQGTDRILIGKRTGFAFYRDHRLQRKILIGVYEGNWRANNYFDGPFDQLPDNFLEGDVLRAIILNIRPELAGKIDRFGGSPDGQFRFMIAPYLRYRGEGDLYPVHACATRQQARAAYARCFVGGDTQPEADEPSGMKRKPPGRRKPAAR
jgi:hypothetical protein